MLRPHTNISSRTRSRVAALTVAVFLLSLVRGPITLVETAEAASSFNPTIFVNTEAFLAIDDDDTSADVVLRFGDTLAKTLTFNRSLDRFEFNDDVHTTGSLAASGAILTESGAYIDGSTFVVQAGNNRVGIGTATPDTALDVVGAISGSTLLIQGAATIAGQTSLGDSSSDFVIVRAGSVEFQNDTNFELLGGQNGLSIDTSTLSVDATTNSIGIRTTTPKATLDVVGSISGAFVYATRSFSGAGLSDCDTAGTSKLLWDAATGRFSCGTDSGTTYTAGQGLNLSTASFRLNTTVTGAVVQAANSLASSGALSWKGTASGQTFNAGGGAATISASGAGFFNTGLKNVDFGIFGTKNNALFYVDANGSGSTAAGSGGIGIGTRTPITQLHVAGAMPMRAQGTVTVSSAPTDVTVHGRYAFITTDTSDSLHIYDVSNPSLPVSVGSIAITGGDPYYVAVQGNYAYVTAYSSNQLRIYDISNPSGPDHISSITVATAGDVAVAGRYAYVLNLGGSVFHVIDIANPSAPVAVSSISTDSSPYDLVVQGHYAYVNTAASMQVIDINNPSVPFVAGSVAANSDGGIAVQGRYVYVTSGIYSTLDVIDVKNPAAPAIVGTYTDGISAFSDVEIQGRYAYLTASTTGRLIAVNVSNPALPTLVNSVKTGNGAIGVSIVGRYAYVVNFSGNSLQTFDLGGAYIQQLEVGGLETTSLDVRTSFRAVNGWFEGGLGAQSLYVFGDAAMSGSLKLTKGFESGSGNIMFSTSGATVFNEQSRNVDLRIEGDTDANLAFFDASLDSVGIGTAAPKAKLAVAGTISGVTLYATKSFSGAGLSDCDDANNSKLLWDATTGRFSCGTDQTGGGSGGAWSNTGSLQLYFDNRFVNVAGDTMTGALAVQNGTVHAATLTALLNVRGTMSGKSLNIMGSGASALLSTDTGSPNVRIGGSGMLLLGTRNAPSTVPANTTGLYAQKVADRPMIHQASGSTFAASALQPSLFGNLIMILSSGGGTTVNGYGTTATNDTTVSHPASGEVFGYMTNFATSTTANDEAGTSSTTTAFFRGSTTGANGFFYSARIGVVDATSITVFSGMADQTIATMVGGDNPAGNHVGFQFSTGRGDTNWMFTTRDGSTQNVNSTGLAFTANKVYDLMFMCTKQCASITWEIRNVTDGTSATGTTSSNLPTTSTALRIVLGVETETTAAKNIRMQQIYVEADR